MHRAPTDSATSEPHLAPEPGDDPLRMMAELCHEIRTPLTSLLGFVDLVRDGSLDASPEQRARALDIIAASGNHLLSLVNGVLDWTRWDARSVSVPAIISPRALVEETVDWLRHHAARDGVELMHCCTPLVPELIQTDATRLRQVLLNLTSNALKFTPRGKVRILVDARCDAAGQWRLAIEVCDTGVGMNPRQLERIFKPYAQGDDGIQETYGGTGLGLSISRRLCDSLGGKLTVESRPGVGSTFRVEIPFELTHDTTACNPQQTHHETNSPPGAFPLLGRRILLADDCQATRRLLMLILQQAGATVLEAADGCTAFSVAKAMSRAAPRRQGADAGSLDAVLLDVNMPREGGLSVARRLRSAGYDRAIIAVSAAQHPAIAAECRDAGCNAFLAKPTSREALLRVVLESVSGAEESLPSG